MKKRILASVLAMLLIMAVSTSALAATRWIKTGNGKSARVKVRVYDPYKPTGVSLDPAGTVEIKVGESLQLNAVLTPENARTTLTWVTSNKKIASVYSSGVVYGRRPGTVAITVYTKNGKKARMYVRVVA